MGFWFRLYSPRQRRAGAPPMTRDHCRAFYPGSAWYWEKDIVPSIVTPDPQNAKGLVVAEVKWRKLNAADNHQLLRDLESKWNRGALSQRHKNIRFEVLDAALLRA